MYKSLRYLSEEKYSTICVHTLQWVAWVNSSNTGRIKGSDWVKSIHSQRLRLSRRTQLLSGEWLGPGHFRLSRIKTQRCGQSQRSWGFDRTDSASYSRNAEGSCGESGWHWIGFAFCQGFGAEIHLTWCRPGGFHCFGNGVPVADLGGHCSELIAVMIFVIDINGLS